MPIDPAPLPTKPCTCKHPASKHALGCYGGWFGQVCKCEGGMVDWSQVNRTFTVRYKVDAEPGYPIGHGMQIPWDYIEHG